MSPKNISLKVKLLGGFLLVASLVTVTSLININASNQIISLFEKVVHEDLQRYNALLAIKSDTNEIINQTLTLALQESESTVDTPSHDEQKNEIIAKVEKIDRNITIYNKSIQQEEKNDVPKLTNLSSMTDTVIDSAFQLLNLQEQKASPTAVLAKQRDLIENQAKLRLEIDGIVQKELTTIEAKNHKLEETVAETINNVYILSFATVLFAIAIAFLISIPIVTKISKLRNAASEVTKGNLQVRLNDNSHDELGELATSFNQMTQTLKEVNEQREKNAEELTKKSDELAQKNKETERINKFMIGRELKMIELKKELEEMKKKVGS